MTPILTLGPVARAANGVIGAKGALPWRLKTDLALFKALTMGKPVIMGRKTYASIGRPLPGRILIVVSRDASTALPDGVTLVGDPQTAVEAADRLGAAAGAAEIMLAGGAALYAELMPQAVRLSITEVDLAPPADAFFPPIDPALWRQADRRPQMPTRDGEPETTFVTYLRR